MLQLRLGSGALARNTFVDLDLDGKITQISDIVEMKSFKSTLVIVIVSMPAKKSNDDQLGGRSNFNVN